MYVAVHKNAVLVRQGWVVVMYHYLEPGTKFCGDSITAGLGGLTLHDDTYNRPLTMGELGTRILKDVAGRTFVFGSGSVAGRSYQPSLLRALDQIHPFVYTNGTEFVTRFDLYFGDDHEVSVS